MGEAAAAGICYQYITGNGRDCPKTWMLPYSHCLR
jgi:hypothetical protein